MGSNLLTALHGMEIPYGPSAHRSIVRDLKCSESVLLVFSEQGFSEESGEGGLISRDVSQNS